MTLDHSFDLAPAFRSTADVDVAELAAVCDRVTDPATVPSASRIVHDVPVFPAEVFVSFWMRDTLVPLDLAYVRADRTVAEVHDLVPHDETPVFSGEPVLYALEVPAGTLAANALGPGDVLTLP